VEEGEVVVGFAVAAGVDAAFGFEPGVGAFDGPAVACLGVGGFDVAVSAAPDFAGWCAVGDRVAGAAAFADLWFDLAVAEGLFERFGGVAAVGPELAGFDLAVGELVEQWQEVALLAFVARGEADGERGAVGVYCEVEAAAWFSQECARDLLAPFFASTSEASTITRDQSSLPAAASSSCKTASARSRTPRRDHSSSRRRQVSPLGSPSSR
jgi:hypothetical protein